jgi:myo-inositol-1(or 4)-monophosphatase
MTNLIQKAIILAMKAHEGQYRKGDEKVPYVLHPLEVGIILSRFTDNENLIVAAILHDVVEDTDIELESIKSEFGEDIAKLVEILTEDKSIEDRTQRKTQYLNRLVNYKVAYMIKAVDALTNMQDLFALIREHGQAGWTYFKSSPDFLMFYYRRILDDLRHDLPNSLIEQYVSALKDLEYSHLLPNDKGELGFKA